MTLYPHEVWTEITRLLLSDDWLVRHRIESLVEFSHDDHLGAGTLFGLEPSLYLNWARKDPKHRASIVMHWLPIANKAADGALSWHPMLESFVAEFGEQDGVLGELSSRLHPRSWWGPIGPLLEPMLPLIDKWSMHPLPSVRAWVNKYRDYLKSEIAKSNLRSEEDVVRYG
jgi:hypothetical protein